jgi:hypothetical protein
MPETNHYFEILHLGERVELRPSASLIGIKNNPPGCFILFLVPALALYWWYGERRLADVWIGIGSVVAIWLIMVSGNRRLRRQATVPLIITPDWYILHGEKLLSAGIVYDSVQLAIHEYSNSNNSKMYNVLLVPAEGEPVPLPQPYFGDLQFHTAELLAIDVAKLLQIPFQRTLMPPE